MYFVLDGFGVGVVCYLKFVVGSVVWRFGYGMGVVVWFIMFSGFVGDVCWCWIGGYFVFGVGVWVFGLVCVGIGWLGLCVVICGICFWKLMELFVGVGYRLLLWWIGYVDCEVDVFGWYVKG